MKDSNSVGQFEQLVLSAIVVLGENAYGFAIFERVCVLADKRVNLGSLYVTLDRLENKGFLKSWVSEPLPERGGRRKKYYRMELAGEVALRESLEASRRAYDAAEGLWTRIRKLRRRGI